MELKLTCQPKLVIDRNFLWNSVSKITISFQNYFYSKMYFILCWRYEKTHLQFPIFGEKEHCIFEKCTLHSFVKVHHEIRLKLTLTLTNISFISRFISWGALYRLMHVICMYNSHTFINHAFFVFVLLHHMLTSHFQKNCFKYAKYYFIKFHETLKVPSKSKSDFSIIERNCMVEDWTLIVKSVAKRKVTCW